MLKKSFMVLLCHVSCSFINFSVAGECENVPVPQGSMEVCYSNNDFSLNKEVKNLLEQNPEVAIANDGCKLQWYDSEKHVLSEVPTPDFSGADVKSKTVFYVSQINADGCESELREVNATKYIFPAPVVKSIMFCQGSEKLKSPFLLTATIYSKGGFPASDYELVWYKENPSVNPNAKEFKFIDLSEEDLSFDSFTEMEKDFKYWVAQRYLGHECGCSGQSVAAELLVTLYSMPILKTQNSNNICQGEEVDLKDCYSISNRIILMEYGCEYFSSDGSNLASTKVTESGIYKIRTYFELSSGEVCASKIEDVFVNVDELKVAIEGDNTTCPDMSVSLTSNIRTNVQDNINVQWKYDGETLKDVMTKPGVSVFETEPLKGSSGDEFIYSLKVTAGACVAEAEHKIVLEDSPIDGSISIQEDANSSEKYVVSSDGIIYVMKGNTVTIDASDIVRTEDDFVWYNGDVPVGSGPKLTVEKPNDYTLYYTNNCQVMIPIHIKEFDSSCDLLDKKNIQVYPTVVSDVLHVTGFDTDEIYSISSVLGVVCLQQKINENGIIDVSSLPMGYYILNLSGRTFSFLKE